jgi:hypothetical protein
MRRRFLLTGLLAIAAAFPLVAAAKPSTASLSPEQRARQIGAEAYVYGYALLAEQNVIVNFPANHLINVTKLSTPAEKLVVLPNVDTLYTVARLTLGSGPMVVHVPNEHGRYYVLELLDAYTNVFGYIGRRVTGTQAGDYAIVGPGFRGSLPAGVKRIQSPTPTVWIIGRTLVNGPSDVANVDAIQHTYTLTPLSGFGGPPAIAYYLPGSELHAAPVPAGLAFYDAMDTAMEQNPPPHSAAALLNSFASVGIAPGRTVSTESLSPATRQGLIDGVADGKKELASYANRFERASEQQHNGWLVAPKATGVYGTNYLLRAYIAEDALGANVPAEATYPAAFVDSALKSMSGAHRYVLHFAAGELPPVNAFWSVTMYGENEFLVPNQLDRYAIGNRTLGLRKGPGGSLDLQLQHSPPHGSKSNWLPAPAGRFILLLRLYQPKATVLHGSWPLPTITEVG